MTGKTTIDNRKKVKLFIILPAVMLAIIVLRLGIDQVQGYMLAIKNLDAGNRKNAIMYFDRVINAHIPFSLIEEKAKAHLIRLADGFEKENELELALLCYETVRTSRHLARHFLVPDRESVKALNAKIASLKAVLLIRDGLVKDFNEGYERQMLIMQRDFSPSVAGSVAAVATFWAYIACIVLWILKGGRKYGFSACLFLAIWMTTLYFA